MIRNDRKIAIALLLLAVAFAAFFWKFGNYKGEPQQVTFYLTERDLAVYSVEKGWHLEPGDYTIMIGGNSENVVLSSSFKLK